MNSDFEKGLNRGVVKRISELKDEPGWMTDFRLRSYEIFKKKPLPSWGPDLSALDLDDITYFVRATEGHVRSWDDLPKKIRDTYDRLGIPEAEKKYLAGVSAQYESEAVYEKLSEQLASQGVIFCDMDTAVREHADIVREHMGRLVPAHDNAFAALNSAVWSGGSFVYVPKGVHAELPLQAYFRIQSERFGQFERTLIIADEDSKVHYIEGCTAPIYKTDSLHAAVVEIFAGKRSHVRYTTVQNWSNNIYNLVTKRARADENATIEWVDGNIGSRATMKYPCVILAGRGARADMLSLSVAGKGQRQDTGAKMIHAAPHTRSRVISRSIARHGGRSSYRGLVHVAPGAKGSASHVSCDALLMDGDSRSDTYPTLRINEDDAAVEHEAKAERMDERRLFYLACRGIAEPDAQGLIVNGFLEPITKELPFEYAIELNRLINMEMEGSVG